MKRGVKLANGRVQTTSPQHEAKPAASRKNARTGTTGSRAWDCQAKAMDEVKHLDEQPRRTPRRKGRGMVGQPSWEQERPVSALAVRPAGRQPERWPRKSGPYKQEAAKWASAERESERPIVLVKPWTTEPRRREGAVLDRRAGRRYAWVNAARLPTPTT